MVAMTSTRLNCWSDVVAGGWGAVADSMVAMTSTRRQRRNCKCRCCCWWLGRRRRLDDDDDDDDDVDAAPAVELFVPLLLVV